MDPTTVMQMTGRVHELLREKTGVGGKTLATSLRRARRGLPRSFRKAGKALLDAETLAKNPNTFKNVDAAELSRAYDICIKELNSMDRAKSKSQARYNMAATIAAQILIVAALAIAFLWWRGLI